MGIKLLLKSTKPRLEVLPKSVGSVFSSLITERQKWIKNLIILHTSFLVRALETTSFITIRKVCYDLSQGTRISNLLQTSKGYLTAKMFFSLSLKVNTSLDVCYKVIIFDKYVFGIKYNFYIISPSLYHYCSLLVYFTVYQRHVSSMNQVFTSNVIKQSSGTLKKLICFHRFHVLVVLIGRNIVLLQIISVLLTVLNLRWYWFLSINSDLETAST